MILLIKIISKLAEKILFNIEWLSNLKWNYSPLAVKPIANISKYYDLFQEAKINTRSVKEIDNYEKNTNFAIDLKWLDNLALYTQIVVKKSPLNYAHGRLIYSSLRKYLEGLDDSYKSINIFETGTARGFSSLCLAKALYDSNFEGKVCTFDVLSNNKEIFWNSITDHSLGQISRSRLLNEWKDLVDRYLVYIQGYSRHMIPKISISRIHFAFLDGAHSYEDVMFEFNFINKNQIKGDVIIFDDYNDYDFKGIVRAISEIANDFGYKILKILNEKFKRGYIIATKL